jgi:threonylcarbamoyladenosine tRNA methylthiotransferase MtaB
MTQTLEVSVTFLSKKEKTVSIETHGCKLNQSDSEELIRDFRKKGYRLAEYNENPDVCVINTCTVTSQADSKARKAIRAAKKKNPSAKLVVTGCYAERAPNEVQKVSGVDVVIGNSEKESLVDLISDDVDHIQDNLGAISVQDDMVSDRIRSMVKIQSGCNQVCAYCIVPKVRGRENSIQVGEIISNIKKLTNSGYREIVLTGTQLGTYGYEFPGMTLRDLIKTILSDTKVDRLRVSSLQPQEIDRDFIALWQDKRLCPHFHMPLQSGSDQVLKLMRRRYTSSQYLNTVSLIRSILPHASITTDVIVGFPGEDDMAFSDTYSFCHNMQFSAMHVFPYSVRQGTSAAYYRDQVSAGKKKQRVQQMIQLSDEQKTTFKESSIGEIRNVLWESALRVGNIDIWSGLTDNYLRVFTTSRINLVNQITRCLITHSNKKGSFVKVLE